MAVKYSLTRTLLENSVAHELQEPVGIEAWTVNGHSVLRRDTDREITDTKVARIK